MKNSNNISMITQEQPYSLHNSENFKQNITQNTTDIVQKYIMLLIEYLKFATEKIINIKNKFYLNYVILRGIETITNVFNNLLYYTKNLGISFFHSQKAYYLYVEFIGQISESQNTFLQLSSKDATLYVYKKTLYELHNDLKKNVIQTKEDCEKLEILQKNSILFKNIIHCLFNKKDFSESSIEEKTKILEEYESICSQITRLIENINITNNKNKNTENKNTENKINILYNLIDNFSNRENINSKKYIEIIDLYVKQVIKNVDLINNNYLTNKVINLDFEEKIYDNDSKDFVKWLLN